MVKVKVMVSIRVLFFVAVVISHSKAFLSGLGCRVTRGFAQTRPKIATLNTALFLSTADFKNGMTFEIGNIYQSTKLPYMTSIDDLLTCAQMECLFDYKSSCM